MTRNAAALLLGSSIFCAGGLEPGRAQAQQNASPFAARFEVSLHPDTLRTVDTTQTSSVLLRQESRTKPGGYESTKSATLAILLSAVAPGAGQIYNESYWKPAVIWALGGYWVYEWAQLNNKYRDFRDQYNQSIEASPPFGDSQLQRIRDFYRDERDKFAWYLGALYFVNLLDAYVGAHLYDFNVSPDLGADGLVYPRGTLTLRWTF